MVKVEYDIPNDVLKLVDALAKQYSCSPSKVIENILRFINFMCEVEMKIEKEAGVPPQMTTFLAGYLKGIYMKVEDVQIDWKNEMK